MFEDEDWNINEDDLNEFNSDDIFKDNNDKADNLLSAKNAETKKETAFLLNTSVLKCADNVQNNVTLQPNESASQKKVVLDIFKNSPNSNQEVLKNDQPISSISENEEPVQCMFNKTNECRKNLILNVFQENVDERPKPIVKSVLKISDNENKFKRKKNVAFVDQGESNVAKKLCTEKANKSHETTKDDNYIDQENQSSTSEANNSKKQRLIDLLKSSVNKANKVPRVKQAVVRKFPGPAGILPDDVNENDVIDLDSLDENKNNKSNQYADICSQNTKNLFSTGAWQLMMDDLPADFELYDIATIKENALQYSKTYKKVPYLAGIVQYIDYKPNDPHVILKDLTGKVDARIHHSICKLYPNALGTSVVILAKDVGLIVTSKKFVCVIISINNLVSIYSDDARLVETPHLKTLFKNSNTNYDLHESQISVLDESECHESNEIHKSHSPKVQNKLQAQRESTSKDECNIINVKDSKNEKGGNSRGISELKGSIRQDTDMHEFELAEDDSWLGVDIDELNSFNSNQFPSSTPMDTHEENSSKVNFQIKKPSVVSKELQNTLESEKIVSGSKKPRSKTISDKLSLFRNTNETSNHSTISRQMGSKDNTSPTTSKHFEHEGNDTDDEMLSQLDVDAIAASYKTQNS